MGDKKLYLEAKLENTALQTREYYKPKLCRQLIISEYLFIVDTNHTMLMFESKYQRIHQDSKKVNKG